MRASINVIRATVTAMAGVKAGVPTPCKVHQDVNTELWGTNIEGRPRMRVRVRARGRARARAGARNRASAGLNQRNACCKRGRDGIRGRGKANAGK